MTVRVAGLKCEQLETPLGLETQRPRLSWRLESEREGAAQSAWRIRVASAPEALAGGGADVWDSGKVSSDQCFDIVYAGPPLASRQRRWWTVDVWDETGAPAEAPAPSWWEMGLLSPDDWSATWIAVESDEDRADRAARLVWVWGETDADALTRQFRLTFEAGEVSAAVLIAGARDRITAMALDGRAIALPVLSPHGFSRQSVEAYDLGALPAGRHVLAIETTVGARPNDPRPPRGAFAGLLKLRGAGGTIRRITTRDWRTSADAAPGWTEPGFDDGGWAGASSSSLNLGQTWPPTPAMLLRRAFALDEPVAQARLYATALGAYEAFLNGTRVGDAMLAPESTDFRKRALYQVYDVTDLVRPGANALAAHVGDGWFASVIAPGGRYAFGPAPRRFLAQLELTFADGARRVVATDGDWRIAPSPVVASEIYNGETYDARREQPGWSEAGFDGAAWAQAQAGETPPARLVAQTSPPLRITGTLVAKSVTEPKPGVFVFDFGQNFAGVAQLCVRGAAGDRVRLRFAEILRPDGEVDQTNLRVARATDTYVLRGDPAGERFTPHFTYHGFRYVQVEGYPGRPTAADLEGLVLQSDLPITGSLRIDNAVIQQLWRNTVWSQRSNFTGVPTDCPQRDERLGWLGDACVFWDAAAFNMDVYAFTQRFAGDMRDAQGPAGGFPNFAPAARKGTEEPAPGWADAGVVLPWTAWMRYGATSIIDAHWDAMMRYLACLEEANPDHLWRNGRGFDFGDWLALEAKQPGDPTTPKDLIGTAWWAHSAGLAAGMAAATGRSDEARRLTAMRGEIAEAFQGAYVTGDGSIGNGSQTSYILPLKFDLVPEELRAAAAKRLADDIERRGKVLSTGFLGTPFALDVLADAGRTDLVYDLLLRTEFPSWGYMIAKGATTIWERWNGDVGDVSMNSFNHYAFGAVCGFLFRRIAGIEPTSPGFKTFRVRPELDPRVPSAGADYDSVLGRISTDWTWIPGERFHLDLRVPPTASAVVDLPASLGATLSLDGARRAAGELTLGAGQHRISVEP